MEIGVYAAVEPQALSIFKTDRNSFESCRPAIYPNDQRDFRAIQTTPSSSAEPQRS